MTGPSTAIASTPGCTAPANTAPKDERAGNGGSIPVGDTAAIERKEKIDALMKRLREAMKKKSTAHAAARDRHEEEENAWDNAMDNLAKKNKATGAEYRDMDHPGVETGKTAHEAYWDALDRQRKAEEGYKAKSDIDRANPTPKSEEDREGAYMERERAEIGVNRVRRSLENSFSKEDRDKLKAARAAARSAEAEEAKADEELRAVEDDLWKTEFAPDKNQPNEEHIPIG